MVLVGQYDSPYVRRVAVSLHELGLAYEHDTRSVFADFDAMRQVNPLGRIPSLIRDDGSVLIDSAAILDWLDGEAGAARALIPPAGRARERCLHRIALACGAIDKMAQAAYEGMIRPADLRWPDWIARCRTQAAGALAALDAEFAAAGAGPDQAQITTACMLRYAHMAQPDLVAPGRYPALDRLAAALEARPSFRATWPADYRLPRAD